MSTQRITVEIQGGLAWYEAGNWYSDDLYLEKYLQNIDLDEQGTFIMGSEPCQDQAIAKAMCEFTGAKIIRLDGFIIEGEVGVVY